MAEWTSDKIFGSSFITHETPNGYEIHFSTPDREKYLAVQEECRRQIDHAKQQTNADKIRQMSDVELADYFAKFETKCYKRVSKKIVCDTMRFAEQHLDWLKQEVE